MVVASSLFNAVAYTGGRWPLGLLHPRLGDVSIGYLGLGDLFVLIYFGFVATCGTYFLVSSAAASSAGAGGRGSGSVPGHVVWAALPTGLLATAIIVVSGGSER
jgi:1,4-dihydroxy-2-naphthoate octaprenyltransferase